MTPFYSNKATRTRRQNGASGTFGLSYEILEDRALLAAVTVGTAVDLVDGNTTTVASLIADPGADGAVSLREALTAANNSSDFDTITFDASVFDGDAVDVIRLQSPLSVGQSVEIIGGDLGVVVSGDSLGDDTLVAESFVTDTDASDIAGVLADNTDRVFQFVGGSGQTSTISGLTITGGASSGGGGGILVDSSDLTLSQSTIAGNRSTEFGGGIASTDSNVSITGSTINGNTTVGISARGGGVYSTSGSLTLSSSTVSGNVAISTIDVSAGGGIFVDSHSSLISDSTITENTANFGGGITVDSPFSAVTLGLENSIVANNMALSASADIATGFSVTVDASFSLIGDRSGTSLAPTAGNANSAGNLIGTLAAPIDPRLAPLADNGGLTQTHALSPESPAVNAGSSTLAADQRGETRTFGDSADIGAFELDELFFIVDTSEGSFDGDFSLGNLSLTEAIMLSSDTPEIETIVFDSSVFNGEAADVIRLEDGLFITQSVTIDGGDLDVVISGDRNGDDLLVDGGFLTDVEENFNGFDNNTPFVINTNVGDTVTIRGLTITGGVNRFQAGGGISNQFSNLIIEDAVISGNSTDGGGGGIVLRSGSLSLTDSVVSNNSSGQNGGGISILDGSLNLTGSAVSDNFANGDGGGIYSFGEGITLLGSTISGNATGSDGGGISINSGILTAEDSVISDNVGLEFSSLGGGVHSFEADVTLFNSTISGNQTNNDGGGISSTSGLVTVINTEIRDNIANDSGGGIITIDADTIIDRSTISDNEATGGGSDGGGILSIGGAVTISNSTISGNSARSNLGSGGIQTFGGNVIITDSTITDNRSPVAGGVSFSPIADSGELLLLTVENSIIANNDSRGDIDFGFDGGVNIDISSSLIGSNERTPLIAAPVDFPDANGNIIGDEFNSIDPLLGQLADNGGPTRTHALLPGSPAIDTGNTTSTVDQRGEVRPNINGTLPDIGAFEEQSLLLTVDTSDDIVDGDFSAGNQSLREAIQRANASDGVDRIIFDSQVFDGDADDVIRLVNGELQITEGLLIDAEGLPVVVSGDALGNDVFDPETFVVDIAASDSNNSLADNSRVFNVTADAGEGVSLNGITITGGSAIGGGGGIAVSFADVELTQVYVSGNRASGSGGGIFSNLGALAFSDSTVSGNTSTGEGGGVAVLNGGVSITGSTVSGNIASGFGGGIYVGAADVSIVSSTLAFNESAIFNGAGGLFNANANASLFEIENTIIASNTAAGVDLDLRFDADSTLDLEFSLIGSNATTSLVAAPAGSPDANGNLIGTSATVIDPLLERLSNNGGPTPTHSLRAASPAIDSGSSAFSFDQRGFPFVRSVGTAVDIGAFESQQLKLLVDNSVDAVDGDFTSGKLSLREAIQLANANPGEDLISFDSVEFSGGTSDTIFLSLGELTISDSLLIDGGDLGVVISGDANQDDSNKTGVVTDLVGTNEAQLADNSGVFDITTANGDLVTLLGLTITGGVGDQVGGISNRTGDLVISRSNISGNRNSDSGGGISNDSGTVTIDRSTISGNQTLSADASGGGIYSDEGDVLISFSTISGNQTTGDTAAGGGIYTVDGAISLNLSTVSGNQTIGNAANGGGIASVSGDLMLDSVTVTQNIAGGEGGGLFVFNSIANPLLTLNNTIVAGNAAASDRPDLGFDSGGLTDIQFSLIGDGTGTSLVAAAAGSPDANGNLIGAAGAVIDPLLGALDDNQGPTLTHELLKGSPAIDAGNSTFVTDQRDDPSFVRNDGEGVDIGSYERIEFQLLVDTASDVVDGDFSAGNLSLREALSLSNGNPSTDVITFDPAVFDGELADVIRLQLGTLDITDEVVIDAGVLDVVISGDRAGDDVLLPGGNVTDISASNSAFTLSENVQVIEILTGAGELVTFNGLTITGGSSFSDGGGISNGVGDLEISNSSISGNRTLNSAEGGGIHSATGNVTLNDSFVTDNVSNDDGGGISSAEGTITLNGSTVQNNLAEFGGGISTDNADVILNDSGVDNNDTFGSIGGGGIYSVGGTVTLVDSSVNNNTNQGRNGAGGGIFTDSGDVMVTNSGVSGNSVSGDGGGIRTNSGSVALSGSNVNNNESIGSSGSGGGIYTWSGDVTLSNSNVNNNTSAGRFRGGGGIFNSLGTVTLNSSSVSDNSATGSSANGGGISAISGFVELVDSIVDNNRSGEFGDGGGIFAFSSGATLVNSRVTNNRTSDSGDGGGIRTAGGNVTLVDSSVSNNSTGASGDGGGISTSSGNVTATRSTLSFNRATDSGGGVSTSSGDLLFVNSTISQNQSDNFGGGIDIQFTGDLQFVNSTVTANQSNAGGGVNLDSSFSDLTIENSILAGNFSEGGSGTDLRFGNSVVTVISFSLIGSNNGTPLSATGPNNPDANGNLVGGSFNALVDPLLSKLSDHGGPTLTHSLLPGSPALDAGGPASIEIGDTDQRGATRVLNERIDIGAVEGIFFGPQVTDVILSSSTFSPNFIDAIDGDGIGDGNGLGHSLVGDQQLVSVPWQNIDTLHLQFLNDVSASLDDGDILLTGTNGGNYSLGPISFDTTTHVATVPILGGVGNDRLVVSILEGTVTDSGGLPVVDTDGGQFNFRFNVLPGDEDGDGQVTTVDAFNVFTSNTDLTFVENARRDIDGSGQINSIDAFAAFANNNGLLPSSLPNSPTAPTAPAMLESSAAMAAIDIAFSQRLDVRETGNDDQFSKAPIASLTPAKPTVDNLFPARTSPDAILKLNESLSNPDASIHDPVSESESVVLAAAQTSSLPNRLVRPQTVVSSATTRAAESASIETYRLNPRPEFLLAGSIEAKAAEEIERNYFSAASQTAGEVDPNLLDSFFQEDNLTITSLE